MHCNPVSIRLLLLSAVAAFVAPVSASATDYGSVVVHAKTTKLVDAYAYHHPAAYDEKVTQTTVLLADRPIAVKAITAAGGKLDAAVHDWLNKQKAVYWEAIFYPDGMYWSGDLVVPGVVTYGGAACTVAMTRNDAERAEGTCRSDNEAAKDDQQEGVYADVKFSVAF